MRPASVIIFIVFFSLPARLFSQTRGSGTLRGRLLDAAAMSESSSDTAIQQKSPGPTDASSEQSLKGATISILNGRDSSLVTYGMSTETGDFEIKGIPFGNYVFQVSFLGYQGVERSFSVGAGKPVFNSGIIYLEISANVLEDIIVHASPIFIKGDTTEFDAVQFKTIPNATTEDLLKKLPGMEVDRDGSIKAQGETVTRVLVDGKPFFGNDPKMATRNLPADIISKIQVIDALSEQSAFSGFDDGDRIRTINIVTRKDKKKGLFGKASVAAGNERRNASAISANRINGKQRISFIGQRNNINNQNFSVQDFLGNKGSGRGGGGKNVYSGNASGISTTTGGGINYNDAFGENTEVSGSYFYNNVNAVNNRQRYRETFVADDSSLFNTNNLVSRNRNETHRANIELEHSFDTMNSIEVRSSYSYQQLNSASQTESFTTVGKLTDLSEVNSVNSYKRFGYNLNNRILFRHKFKKRGRTFSVSITNGLSTNDRSSINLSYNKRYSRGIDTLDQISNTNIKGNNIGARLSYTEPLSLNSQLELTYNYNNNHSNSDQQTYKLDNTTGKHSIGVPNLTNLFRNSNRSHRAGINYRMQVSREWNYSLGMAVQHSDLVSNNLTSQAFLNQSFINLFPNVNIQFRQGRSKNLRFSYRGSTRQPSITQLQDVINNTNILNIRSGNPSLKQEFSNDLSVSYRSLDLRNFRNIFISLKGSVVSNGIANTSIINAGRDSILVDGYYLIPGAKFSKPRNLNGAYELNANFNYGFALKSPKSHINFGSRLNYSRDVNLFNNIKSFTHNYVIGGYLRYSMNLKNSIDLNFSTNSTYNIARYSSQSEQNGDFFNQRFSVEPTYTNRNGWILSNDIDYEINTGQTAGFNQSVLLWNAGLAKLFLKGRVGELRLTVFDLFNGNKNITRNVRQNYIEDVKTDVLNRYFLISFTYHLRKFNGGQKQKDNNFQRPRRDTHDYEDRNNNGAG